MGLWAMLATVAVPLVCLASNGARQADKVKVGVKAVTVYATVRDRHGRIITNLDKDDFVLKQDGETQAIQYFSQESDLPLTLGLLVDTILSQRNVLDAERSASYGFLDHMLGGTPANGGAKDQAFLIHFDREVELLQDLTSSRQKLQSALADLHTPEMERRPQGGGGSQGQGGGWPPDDGGPQGNPRGGRRGQGWHGPGTLLYDAIYLASHDVMQKQKGRKSLVVLSDGVDRGSQETLEEAMEAAQRSDTIVYSILFAGDHPSSFRPRGGFGGWGGMGRPGSRFPGRFPREERPDGKKILEKISRETGGEMFQVSKKLPIDAIYAQIEQELRSQYSLAYTPEPDPTPGYHKIGLTTKKKGLIVQAREGYYYSGAPADSQDHP